MSNEQYFGDIQDENKSTINNVGWLYWQKYRLSHEKRGTMSDNFTWQRATNDPSTNANNLFLINICCICLVCSRIVIFLKPGTIIYIPSTVRIVYSSPVLVFLMDAFFALVPIFILVGFPYGIYKTEVINHSLSNRT